MSSIDRRTTPEQLAARVSEALEAAGIHAVLSGGGAVTIYTDNAYQSKDLDFVSSASTVAIQSALEPLGFRLERRRYFAHPDTDFLLEFPAGPLGFGHLVVDTSDELATPDGVVRIISPTHCVMDRLAAWFHWADRQGLDQAVSVAARQGVDLAALRAWAKAEGHAEKFETFLELLDPDG